MEKRTKIPSTEMSIFTEPGVPSFLLPGTKVDAWVSSDSSGELKIASTPFCSRRFLASSSSCMRRPPSSHSQVTPLVYSRETRTVRTRRTSASVIPPRERQNPRDLQHTCVGPSLLLQFTFFRITDRHSRIESH